MCLSETQCPLLRRLKKNKNETWTQNLHAKCDRISEGQKDRQCDPYILPYRGHKKGALRIFYQQQKRDGAERDKDFITIFAKQYN